MLNVMRFFEGQGSWIRRLEHLVLRGVSFVFSVGGAYAFASFFAPLDAGDFIQGVITVSLSVALGLASYFLSRSIADRLMALFDKGSDSTGSWWSIALFVPLFLVCEFLEIFTNYAKAIPAIHRTEWLNLVASDQRPFHMFCTYLVYCVVPLVSPCLAVVDMGLGRKKSQQQPVLQPVQQQVPAQSVRSQVPPLQPKQPQVQRGAAVSPPSGVTRPPSQTQQGGVGSPPPGVTRPQSQPQGVTV